jgi:hypothetical protein
LQVRDITAIGIGNVRHQAEGPKPAIRLLTNKSTRFRCKIDIVHTFDTLIVRVIALITNTRAGPISQDELGAKLSKK